MFKKKWMIWAAAGLTAAALALGGCGGNSKPASSAASGAGQEVIRVGSETTFPPFEFTEGDKYVGFDLDLANAVIKQMGARMEFKSMGFDALIPAVQSGQIDLIVAGMDATPERAKQVAFSDVYFNQSGYVIVVRKDNDQIHDWNDLNGKVVGAQVGTKPVQIAQDNKAAQVKQFDSNAQSFLELQAKTVDAVIIDRAVGMYYMKKGGDQDLQIVGTPKESAGMVMAMKKNNTQLQSRVNKALAEIKADGTYDKIFEKWFGKQN
ncbi:MAG TPA: basic amino acid ABC transporter substrate-binding protein [Veillonellaceae bacterium]|jgi:polar amino acid transport system substrate-binding protein|nr:basic amino acid ABC transporter substrate-binding protein [Veillonellaceae bacterium]